MGYYIDDAKVSLDDLCKRIIETDLVPSRSSLLEGIESKFTRLKENGFTTCADLRKQLKNLKNIPSITKATGIDSTYLTLLRREIEGFFPKAFPIKSFDWLPENELTKLEKHGLKNTLLLYDAMHSSKTELIDTLQIEPQVLDALRSLTDLTRIQWVGPTVARLLLAAGYPDAISVSRANAEKMCNELDAINREINIYHGKIGLRDVKRLIQAASHVP